MSELAGLLLLVVGLGALAATGALAACCLRLRSPVAFLLTSYLVAWAWLVALTLALSPARWMTRGSLLAGLVAGLAVALPCWNALRRPRPPGLRRGLERLQDALRDPTVLVLAAVVTLGVTYVCALAFFTPSNDMDALEYHLARAALWRQEQGLDHIPHVDDPRVNFFPPNAEIGQLATMLLASSDRYAAVPQLLAFAALVVSVGGLAGRIGLSHREATFAALAFATLPVVLVQAPTAMNDLVVASFLTAAAYFGTAGGRAALFLFAVAVGLAVGAKYTALIALPALAVVVAVAQPVRRWPHLAIAGVAGCAAGSVWYVVNVLEAGRPDPDVPSQRADLSFVPLTVMALRLLISFVDMSGAPGPYALAYVVAAAALAVAGVVAIRRSSRHGPSLLVGAGLTAAVMATPLVWDVVVRGPFKLALLLGRDDVVNRFSWVLNTKAEPLVAGYGPLALLLLVVTSVAVVVGWRRHRLPATALAFAAAPPIAVASLTLALSYDVTRARFLLFGVAVAAATWGLALRIPSVAFAVAGIGSAAVFLSLANYHGKPSGLFAQPSIWSMPRWAAQTTRNGLGSDVLAYAETSIPEDARLALSIVGDDWIHPFFGARLSRHVTLVSPHGGSPPAEARWLVLSPRADVRRCPEAWSVEHANEVGWRVERRLAPDTCVAAP